MATAGYNSRIYFNERRLSPYLNSIDFAKPFDTEDVSTFESVDKKHLAIKRDGTSSISGWWDEDVDSQLEGVFDGSEGYLSYYPGGTAAGAYGKLAKVIMGSLDTNSGQAGVVDMAGTFQCTELNRSVVSLLTETTYSATASTTGVDGTAQTTAGGNAVIHCTAVTGTVSVQFEDSPDNSMWSLLAPAVDISAVGAQVVSISGAIERYTRVTVTLGGGESITLQAGINRL